NDSATVQGLCVRCGFALETTRSSNIATSLHLPPRSCRLRIRRERQFLVLDIWSTAPRLALQFQTCSTYLPQLLLPWQKRTLEEPRRPSETKPERLKTLARSSKSSATASD